MNRFERVGNNLAVDFANTVYADGRDDGSIHTSDDVLGFLTETSALDPSAIRRHRAELRDQPHERERVLRRALALRRAIAAALDAIARRRRVSGEALDCINETLALNRGCERLVRERSQLAVTFEADRRDAETVLVPIARAAASVLAGDLASLRKCADPQCVRYFYDDSRTKRRRWCSMALCGNRAKVAAFAARHGDGKGADS